MRPVERVGCGHGEGPTTRRKVGWGQGVKVPHSPPPPCPSLHVGCSLTGSLLPPPTHTHTHTHLPAYRLPATWTSPRSAARWHVSRPGRHARWRKSRPAQQRALPPSPAARRSSTRTGPVPAGMPARQALGRQPPGQPARGVWAWAIRPSAQGVSVWARRALDRPPLAQGAWVWVLAYPPSAHSAQGVWVRAPQPLAHQL